jgi:hypothetical protein
MKSRVARHTLLAASVALLTAGCATQNPPPSPHVHRGVEPYQMHEKMAAATSDAERIALMSEHMRMMHTMMESMMNRMDAMPAK